MKQIATKDTQNHIGGIRLHITIGAVSIVKGRVKDEKDQKKLDEKYETCLEKLIFEGLPCGTLNFDHLLQGQKICCAVNAAINGQLFGVVWFCEFIRKGIFWQIRGLTIILNECLESIFHIVFNTVNECNAEL
jgi:hypothetical protein